MNNETVRETVGKVFGEALRMRAEDNRFYAELNAESDRGAAILAAEYFDGRLRNAIETKFAELEDGLLKRLQEQNDLRRRFFGSSFSTRINIAYVLGLYDQETKERLNDVREIRNSFAHPSMSEPLDFNTQCLVDKCARFPLKNSAGSG